MTEEILYLHHAVERMMQRKISAAKVELVISSPDGKIKQSKDKYIYYKKISGRKDNLIAVVARKLEGIESIEVITVMINFEVK